MKIIFLTRPPFPIQLKLSGSALQTPLQISQHRVSQLSTYCDMYPFQWMPVSVPTWSLVQLSAIPQFVLSSKQINNKLGCCPKSGGCDCAAPVLGWILLMRTEAMYHHGYTIAKYSQQTHFCSDAQIILFSCQAISIGGTTLDQ